MLEKILNKTRKTSLLFTWLAGGLIILSAIVVTIEVFLRKLFNISLGGADELSGYAFGIATSLSLSFALFERAHIRVDALFNILPNKLRPLINFLGLFLLLGFAIIVATMIGFMVMDTLKYGSRSITPLRVPLALPQIPWLFGWAFFVFSGILIAIVALIRFFKKDKIGTNQLIGIKTVEEQIKDETV